MSYAEYVNVMNDPRRPMGLWGPRGGPAYYRIDAARPLAPGRGTAHDDVAEFRRRLQAHAEDEATNKVIARLRRLR